MTNVPAQLPDKQKILEVLYTLSYRTRDLKSYLKIIAQGVSDLLHIDWSVVTFCRDGKAPEGYRAYLGLPLRTSFATAIDNY